MEYSLFTFSSLCDDKTLQWFRLSVIRTVEMEDLDKTSVIGEVTDGGSREWTFYRGRKKCNQRKRVDDTLLHVISLTKFMFSSKME